MATTEETSNQLAQAKAALEAAEREHAAALAEEDDNRTPLELVTALLEAIVMRSGNRPDQAALLKRLSTAVKAQPATHGVDERDNAELAFRAALDQNPAPGSEPQGPAKPTA